MTLGSIAARNGAISFDGLQQRRYKPMQTCNRSKLACIMFAFELSRRSKASGRGVESLGAHPGVTRTDLIPNGAARPSINGMAGRFQAFLFHPAWDGACHGPDKMGGTRGYRTQENPPKPALDSAVAARLWETSLGPTDVIE